MYQLEERILFDGAAVAAVVVANQQHNDAANNDAAKNDAAHNNQNQNQDQNQQAQQHNPHTQNHSDITKPNPDGVTQQHTGVDNLLAQALGLDSSTASTHNSGAAEKHVNVMVISTSLDNADAVASLADANTIVVKYDSHNTTSAQLLAQINESLQGKKADSIAFLSEAGDGQLSLFKDGKTTVTSLNDSVQQQFWHGVEGMLDSHGRVDFLASNLASTAAGKALVTEISHITGHETAASTDLTGNSTKGGDWNLEFTAGGQDARQVDLVQTYLNRNILDSFTAVIPADTIQHEVAFINSTVKDVDTIIKQLGSDVDIVRLDAANAFEEIQAYLDSHSNIDAIHIFTHGNDGYFKIGATNVDNTFLDANGKLFAAWEKSLTKDADIMIYGCDVASDVAGKTLINRLAMITGADIATSTDVTGRDGNWTLEYNTGMIDVASYAITGYNYNLAEITLTVKSINDDPVVLPILEPYTLREAIYKANSDLANDYVIQFADQATLKGDTITINDSLGQFVLKNNITIDGKSFVSGDTYVLMTIDAQNVSRHFTINTGANVILCNLILANGYAQSVGEVPGNGGSIYNAGTLWINDSMIIGNRADNAGGGIYNTGSLTLSSDESSSVNPHFRHWNTVIPLFVSNVAGVAGGAVYNDAAGSLAIVETTSGSYYSEFMSNSVTNGSGGAIYSLGSMTAEQAWFSENSANGDGGAIYISGAQSDIHFYNVNFTENTATGSGGGLFFTLGKNLIIEWSDFVSNSASMNGGAIFFDNSGNLTIETTSDINHGKNVSGYMGSNTAGWNGGAVYMHNSETLNVDFYQFMSNTAGNSSNGGNGGAFYIVNSGNAVFNEAEISYNTAIAGSANEGLGGGIYYTAPNSASATVTVQYSGISYNTASRGGAIYQDANTLSVINSTLAYNTTSGNGGGIWFGGSGLTLTFDTLAYNQAPGAEGGTIYVEALTAVTFAIQNSLIFNNDVNAATALNSNSQIYLGAETTLGSHNNNIFSHYYTNQGMPLSDGTYTAITTTLRDGRTATVGYKDGLNNIVGYDAVKSSILVQSNVFLDTSLNYNANYRTQSLAILYRESLALGAGISVGGITHDQRGNSRTGYGVNGNANATPSIGAFESLFYATVNSKGDDSALIYTYDQSGRYFDTARSNGLTLREAIYWIDTYDPTATPLTSKVEIGGTIVDAQYVIVDTSRYVKFDSTVFTAGSSTINLTYGSITIGGITLGNYYSKNIRVSITPDGTWQADSSYVAQNAANRIIVDGGGVSRIFTISGGSYVDVSNLTLQNGKVTSATGRESSNNGEYGRGGAIWIETGSEVVLNNVLIQNCLADNIELGKNNYKITGWGGGIYNAGTLTLNYSTVTNNTATAYGTSKYPVTAAGLGGGIYNDGGILAINGSTIDHNTANGEITNVTDSVKGGGIYSDGGTLVITNSTIAYNTLNASQAIKVDEGAGSAIYMLNGTNATIYYCTIAYNTTLLSGSYKLPDAMRAALTINGGMLALSNTIFGQNTARVNNASDPAVTPIDIYVGTGTAIASGSSYDAQYNIIPYFNYDAETSSGFDWSQYATNRTGVTASDNILYFMSDTLAYNGGKTMNFRLYDGSWGLDSGYAITGIDYDQRGASRSQLDRTGSATPTIGAYEALTEIYVTASGDTGSTPAISGFDFSNNRPGFYSDSVTLRDALYWADPEAIVKVRYADGSPNWISSKIVLQYKDLIISKGLNLDGTIYYYNDVDRNTDEKVITSITAPNEYSYYIGETSGLTVYYDIYRSQYYYVSGSTNVYLASNALLPADVTKVDVTDSDGNVKYSYYTYVDPIDAGITRRAVGTWDTLSSSMQYFYLTETGGAIVALAQVGTTITAADFSARTINTQTQITVDANKQSRVFNVDNGDAHNTISVGILNMTVENGDTTSTAGNKQGGGIYSFENLTLTNVVLSNNLSSSFGGGIYIQSGRLNIVNCTISGNRSGSDGGGAFSSGGEVYVLNSSFLDNNSTGRGGGMFVAGATIFDVNLSTFGRNAADSHGGGIYSDASNLNMVNSTISENTAAMNGGGLAFTGGGDLTLTYVTIGNNTAGTAGGNVRFGGGLYMTAGNITMIDSIIANNYSVNTSTYDDFYASGGYITATYSAVGASFGFDFGMMTGNITGNEFGIIEGLGLSSTLEYNGGTTMTLYLAQDSVAASAGIDVPGIATSQNGKDRKASPSMGAYESRVDRYIYQGAILPDGIINADNWVIEGGVATAGTFDQVDATFVINSTASGDLTVTWNVNSRSVIEISETGMLTIESGAAIHAITTPTHPTEKVNINILDTGNLTMANNDIAQTALHTVVDTTTVVYSYAGDLTILTATYGDLTISGGGTKTSAAALTVNGAFGLTLDATSLTVGGDLTATGITMTDGTINSGSNAITVSGDTTGAGTNSIAGGGIVLGGLSSFSGNISGTSVNIGGAAVITGNITATDAIVLNDTLTMTTGAVTGNTIDITGAAVLDNSSLVATDAVTLGDALNIVSGAVSGKTVSATGAVMLDGSSITADTAITMDSTLTVFGDSSVNSQSITMTFGLTNVITVNDGSILTINTASSDIVVNTTTPETTPNTFNISDITVAPTGTLAFITTGNMTFDNVTGSAADNITGTLSLTANDISMNGAVFNNLNELVLNNSGLLNIGGTFLINNSVTFNGMVNITADAVIEVTKGNLTFNSDILANSHDLTLIADLGRVTLANINLVKDLTVTGLNGITLQGSIDSIGTATFNDNIIITGTDTGISAANINFYGNITGTGNLSLTSTGVDSNNLTSINIGGTLSIVQGEFFSTNDIIAGNLNNAGSLLLLAGGSIITGNVINDGFLTAMNIVAGGNLDNTGTVFADAFTISGNLNNGGGVLTANADVNIGGNLINAGTMTANADMYVGGNITSSGTLTSLGILSLNGTSAQTIRLSGTTSLNVVDLNNLAGATLSSGIMDVEIFLFSQGKFTIGDGNVIIGTSVSNAGTDNYFITGGSGRLYMSVSELTSTTFWIGSRDYVNQLELQKTVVGTELIGVRSVSDIITQGSTIDGIKDAVNCTWIVSRGIGGSDPLNAVFHWQPGAEGIEFKTETRAVLATTVDNKFWTKATPQDIAMPGHDSAAFTLTTSGSYAVAGPGASFESPTSFKGLNNSNANSSGFYYPSIAVDVPPSQGEYSFDMMQLYLAESPLGNPLGVSIPGTGTDIGGDYANDFMTITTGESVYGAPNGERGVNTQWTPEETREPDPVGEELDRQLDDFFTELADNSMHEKHPAFKSEVEILLDKLLAS